MARDNGTVPQAAQSTRKAHELLKELASGPALRNVTPVVGVGVPEGLCVRVLTYTEAKDLQQMGEEFAQEYAGSKHEALPAGEKPALDAGEKSILIAALQVAAIAVDDQGTPVFRPSDEAKLPQGSPDSPFATGSHKHDLWVGMLQVLAFVPVSAIVLITQAATRAMDDQRANLGKASSAAPNTSS